MRIFSLGIDKGNAVMLSLILILVFSLLFLSLIPRVIATKRYANEYKTKVINDIQSANWELRERYDIY